MRASQNRKVGNPGPEGSIAKLMFAEVNKQRLRALRRPARRRRAGRLRLHHAALGGARPGRAARARPASSSCGHGPTRSRAAPPRSSATSSASGSSACPATSGWTRSCPGPRSRAVESASGKPRHPAAAPRRRPDGDRRPPLPRDGAARRPPPLAPRRSCPSSPRPGTSSSAGAGSAPPWSPSRRPPDGRRCGRPCQYLSFAPTGSVLDLTVTLAAEGTRVTQAPGGRHGRRRGDPDRQRRARAPDPLGRRRGVGAPAGGAAPDECPPRRLPDFFSTSIFDQIDVRLARGHTFEELAPGPSAPGEPTSALWARVPGHLEPSAATLAILGDYVTGGVSQPLGRRVMSRSLDNTLRVVTPRADRVGAVRHPHPGAGPRVRPGHRLPLVAAGMLLATASQSMRLRFWPGEQPDGALRSAVPEVRSGGRDRAGP